MEVNRCHETGICDHMAKRVGDGGKGFKALHTVSRDSNVTRFLGVAYKLSAKDKGLLLNWCPFCGGQPGYFKRDAPQMTDDELRELWRINGGRFHGPNIETGTMPEAQLLPLMRALMTPNVDVTGPRLRGSGGQQGSTAPEAPLGD